MDDEAPTQRNPGPFPKPPAKPVVIREAPPASGRSIWPMSLHKEAGTKVSISLGFVGALMWGSYQLGSQRARDSEVVADSIEKLSRELESVSRTLGESKSECSSSVRSIAVIEGRIASIQATLVTIDSKLTR